MGLFDFFGKPQPPKPAPQPSVSLPQLCYDVAYFILPHYAYRDLEKVAALCTDSPAAAGPFFYAMAAIQRKIEPNAEDARCFYWHRGELRAGREYFVLEYPQPPAVDILADTPIEQLFDTRIVLAPYFSAILRGSGDVSYFILGQAPMGGGTTLRSITSDLSANCNHGPGPEPQLDKFLDTLRERDS
ncbi:MAG TPA: hypothetical protein VHB77_23320 [Planctomycetaceae bacterium]|nr:hypothetical protein [Planctomycetaceae bacterium]